MKYVSALRKCFLFSLILAGFFINMFFRRLTGTQNRNFIKKCGQTALRVLNVKVTVQGDPPDQTENFLIVCNHLSYLDVLILCSFVKNSCFIASKDILKLKLLGKIAASARAFAVERKQYKKIQNDIVKLKNILLSGRNVILFPEGSAGDGKAIQNFKPPFFEAAVLSKKRTLPVCINYLSIDGNPLSEINKHKLLYNLRRPVVKHFFTLCRSRSIECEIVWIAPLPSSNHTDRKELAEKAKSRIAECFKPFASHPIRLIDRSV